MGTGYDYDSLCVGDWVMWGRRVFDPWTNGLSPTRWRMAIVTRLGKNGAADVRLVGGKQDFHTHVSSLEAIEYEA